MLSITHIRGIQAALQPLATLSGTAAVNAALRDALRQPGHELAMSRVVDANGIEGSAARSVLFRYRSDPVYAAHLVLPDNRAPADAYHLEGTKNLRFPTLVGLHYVYTAHRRATAAHYMLTGALAAFESETEGFEYAKFTRKTKTAQQVAALAYVLNLPVEDLPYKPRTKLKTLGIFEELGILRVGDIVRRDPAELEAKLGKTSWTSVRTMLLKMSLIPGSPVPQWKAFPPITH